MKTIWIFGGGHVNLEFAKRYMKNHPSKEAMIIAADRGLMPVIKMGLHPDIILGDFDSVDKNVMKKFYRERNVSIRSFPPEKDFTDMELAVESALLLSPTEICIFGATGTRLDHVLGNIFCLEAPMKSGVLTKIIDDHNTISLLGVGEHVFDRSNYEGKYYSFLPYTQSCRVSLEGFKYSLCDYLMEKGKTLGVSNEAERDSLKVDIKEGIMIFINSHD